MWDSSAVVPLLLREAASDDMLATHTSDPVMLVWWATPVECASAVARLEREGGITGDEAEEALARLRALAVSWAVVEPVDRLLELAQRLLRVHPLRAADALQLAAAQAAAEERPATLELVCLDERLAAAARREGFRVLGRGRSAP